MIDLNPNFISVRYKVTYVMVSWNTSSERTLSIPPLFLFISFNLLSAGKMELFCIHVITIVSALIVMISYDFEREIISTHIVV